MSEPFEFTEGERALLHDLQRNPEWREILKKLGDERRLRPYTPGKGAPDDQAAKWQYYSGVDAGRDAVLKRLADGR